MLSSARRYKCLLKYQIFNFVWIFMETWNVDLKYGCTGRHSVQNG